MLYIWSSSIYPKQNTKKYLDEKAKYNRNCKKVNGDKFEQDLEHKLGRSSKSKWQKCWYHSGKFLTNNSLLEKHALKQTTKKEIKTKSKPWITTGILTSIRNKNKIYIQQILQSKRPKTKKFTTLAVQKL